MATMSGIKEAILVLSGKGGVGKSTVATQISHGLSKGQQKIGLLDIDLTGPSIPRIMGMMESKVAKSNTQKWIPVSCEKNLSVMSIGFLLPDRDAPVVWRGPKKTSMIKQFIEEVLWGDLDILVIDTPPGTSDEHLSIVETLSNQNIPVRSVIVTTPQGISISDVRREITFCQKLKIPILGIIENMSGFICPCCNEITNIFSSEGGKILAEQTQVPFLGKVPIDPSFSNLSIVQQESSNFEEKKSEMPVLSSTSLVAIQGVIEKIRQNLSEEK